MRRNHGPFSDSGERHRDGSKRHDVSKSESSFVEGNLELPATPPAPSGFSVDERRMDSAFNGKLNFSTTSVVGPNSGW